MNECAVNILMKPAVQRTILCVDHQNNLLWTMDIQLCVIKNIAKGSPAASLLNRPLYITLEGTNSTPYCHLAIQLLWISQKFTARWGHGEYLQYFNIWISSILLFEYSNIWISSIFQYFIYLQYLTIFNIFQGGGHGECCHCFLSCCECSKSCQTFNLETEIYFTFIFS